MDEDAYLKNKKRYYVLYAGIIIQFCAGTLYMWSVYKEPVAAYLSWDPASSALTSSFMLASFVGGIIIGGRIMDKIGPRKICVIGSLMLSFGILASSLVTSGFPQMIYITYGIIGGIGVGIVYTCTVSPIQKWFFDKKGFATGLLVGAFGLSLVLFAPLANLLLSVVNVPYTFLIFGVAFLIVCVPASLFIVSPPAGYVIPKTSVAATQKQYAPKEMLRTKAFYLIMVSMFFIVSAYFVLNPQFISLGEHKGLEHNVAVMAVMITGLCSAGGRITISWMSDITGRISGLLVIFALTLTGVVLLMFAQGALYIVCLALIAFGYGGVAGMYAVMTSDNFGTKNMGSNYGLVLVGFGASALMFPFLSAKFPLTESNVVFIVCAVACVATLVCVLLLSKYAIADYKIRRSQT